MVSSCTQVSAWVDPKRRHARGKVLAKQEGGDFSFDAETCLSFNSTGTQLHPDGQVMCSPPATRANLCLHWLLVITPACSGQRSNRPPGFYTGSGHGKLSRRISLHDTACKSLCEGDTTPVPVWTANRAPGMSAAAGVPRP